MNKIALSVAVTFLLVGQHADAGDKSGQLITLPRLSAAWKLQSDPERDTLRKTIPYCWCVFKHSETGDFLSFASLRNDNAAKTELEKCADTAFEIFPNGQPVWTKPSEVGKIESLSTTVSKRANSSIANGEMLQYCFVSAEAAKQNFMAHGRAWVQNDTVFFVQHTSARPITSSVIRDATRSYIRRIKLSSDGAK